MTTRDTGQQAETLAASFMLQQGYSLLTRNFHCRYGELDLVMRKQQLIVFVEVRYRRNSDWGQAIETVTWRKQQKLRKTAEYFIHQNGQMLKTLPEPDFRFDLIALDSLDPHSRPDWIQGAWE